MQRLGHVVIAGGLAALAAAEWLHGGGSGAGWAWTAGATGGGLAATALALWRRPRSAAPVLAALASLALAGVLVAGHLIVRRIECCWPALQERRVTTASRALQAALADAIAHAQRLAEAGARAALLPRERAIEDLARAIAVGPRGIERGVAILKPNGDPVAWAGRHRAVPALGSAELRAVITPFYAALEARRQTHAGVSVGTIMLDAAPALSNQGRTIAAAFAREHGVALRFFGPGQGPRDSSVFELCPTSCEHSATLVSVQTLPPSQGDSKLAAVARTARLAGIALAVTLLLLVVAAPPGAWRWGTAAAGTWVVARAPLAPWSALEALFSPATFYREAVGGLALSAGSLAVLGAAVLVGAGALWRRGLARRWWTVAPAGLLVLVAPYVVRNLGRGIEPPASGVSFGLWLSWQAALALAGMALVLLAAALVRGPAEPRRVPWTLPVACGWAVLAAVAGLWLWGPYGAWPEWYTFLWLPALAGVLVPAPRRWALPAVATVAGTAAALVTWGATLEGRLALANQDVQRLGREGDAVAVALLERLGAQATNAPALRTAGDLYALWLGSPLAAEAYPTVLALWGRDGAPRAELRLAEGLDLAPDTLAALARHGAVAPRVERLERSPGVHYVLVAPLASGTVLTVGVGPRSQLLPPDRVARFLRGEPAADPPFTILLGLPSPPPATPSALVVWERRGWAARGERRLDLPGGVRHAHVRVDLREPWALLARGALVVLVDLALLAITWALGALLAGSAVLRIPSVLPVLRASYRARLAAALAAFFVTPVLAFAVWSFARLGDEARRAGELLVRQALRDAAAVAGAGGAPVVALGARLDADLWLYRGGVLEGTSAPVLGELGLVDPFLAPAVFRRLALEDELEVTADARTAGRPVRVGYRVVRQGPPGEQAILAAPQLLDDERVRRQQEDLALVLMLATLAGLGAAVYLAGLAARGLTHPVAALREAALAVGRGATPPPFPPGAPREFDPVMSAFDRMVIDVRRSQAALEEARRRTAQVLANVATGVIAVDDALRVTLANPRAAELLGAGLEPGDLLPLATADAWGPVWDAVRAHLAGGGDAIVDREFEIGGRQIRVQLARTAPTPDGCVIALDDATALTRAARVLAWGEMARQVAHEIKNPLTPIRLGIQHLQRARGGRSRPAEFDATFEETAGRILAEIDRLDAIARAFARFGAPATAEVVPLEAVDLMGAAREVVQLYALGGGGSRGAGARVQLAGDGGGQPALARADEVKEVLINLLENARQAGAKHVVVRVTNRGRTLSVEDDGRGIPPETLPRVFEPTFSTTSSGAGLGLAIARRLVESWGGTIALTSEVGRGTTVTLQLEAGEAGRPR